MKDFLEAVGYTEYQKLSTVEKVQAWAFIAGFAILFCLFSAMIEAI